MASVRKFSFSRYEYDGEALNDDKLVVSGHIAIVPRIFWLDGSEWKEASLYLAWLADETGIGDQALLSNAKHLKAYADFLENKVVEGLTWDEFGPRKRSRPTYRFRRHLIEQRDDIREIAPSTASNRIAAVKRFYEWVVRVNLFNPAYPAFTPIQRKVKISSWFGLKDSITIHTSDLAIPNTARKGTILEDGLIPLSGADRDKALELARQHCIEEFALALEIGFFSGLRIGSIIGLHEGTLSAAKPSSTFEQHWEIPVGPHHGVATKNNINYWAVVPDFTMGRLAVYAQSKRRRCRRDRQSKKNIQIFLNKYGTQLTSTSWQEQMAKLRRVAALERLDLRHFYFHCTRATFGTFLLNHMLSNPTTSTQTALSILKRVMGHAHEATSLTYVRWLDEHDAVTTLIDDYGRSLMGRTA